METKKNITDAQIDDLIMASLERKVLAEDITLSVMKDLRRQARRRQLRQWGRAAAFAFGLPLVLLLFGWLLWPFVSQQGQGSPIYICLAIPVAVMLYSAWRAVGSFSPSEV